ncbi:MAG: Crp/Fnr family transcriptional regulator [Thermodesulfobacteriota bacterium]
MVIETRDKILIERFLRRVPIFRNLAENHLKQVIKDFKILCVNKSETILFQSDESTDLYIVLKGNVRVIFLDQEGDELILTTFNEGDFFGEMSLIDGKPRSATVVAEEDTMLGVLKRERFFHAIKQNPLIAVDLLTALVERLRRADEMIESLAFLNVRERLIKYLVAIAKKGNEKEKNGFYRIKKLVPKELAVRIGASREAITKMLKVLASEKAIIEKGGYLLLSPDVYAEADKRFT